MPRDTPKEAENTSAEDADACGVTVLVTEGGKYATKRWSWNPALGEWSKRGYSAGSLFFPYERPVLNLDELVTLLDKVRQNPRAFIVRGALTNAVRRQI